MLILRFILGLIVFGLIMNQAEACGSHVQVVEPVYITDLKSVGSGHEGSSPSLDTINAAGQDSPKGASTSPSIGLVSRTGEIKEDTLPAELAPAAPYSKWWVTMPITSWHKENKDYNERNWGIGLEYKQTDSWSWVGGTYRNSFYKQSYYLGGVYAPLAFEMREVNITLGLLLGFFSGYDNKIVFLTPPVVQVEVFKKWGGDILMGDGFVGFSLKFNKGVLE